MIIDIVIYYKALHEVCFSKCVNIRDQEREFNNKLNAQLMKLMGTDHCLTIYPYHPQVYILR